MCGLARGPNQHLCHARSLIQSINYSIHLLYKDLQTNSRPGTLLGTRDTAGNETAQVSAKLKLRSGVGEGCCKPSICNLQTASRNSPEIRGGLHALLCILCKILWILAYGNIYKLPLGFMISEPTGPGNAQSTPFCHRGGNGAPKKCDIAKALQSLCCCCKSLQSCPTLCDPIDGSPPGSPVPGILQARTLEWVAISFSNA